ncbi:fatty acid desaturase CarF family protein [Ponticaulis profundi]|uniref:Fatty acid desaturase CarF family protein n=1 Tax=Ponticaulis profundi TaxID=2665222 RepID=A0ABW1S928_9PROT
MSGFEWALALQVVWVGGQILAGLLIADFVSGFFHWMEDRYGGPSWPIVGPLIRATIRHHKKPLRMTKVGFAKRNGPTLFIAGLFLLGFVALGWVNPMTITGVLFGGMANEFHNWAHRKPSENGMVIRFLQKSGIIISFEEHAKHHRNKKNTHYCAVNGWLNAPLERIRFWRRLEALIRVFGRFRPRRDPTVRRRPIQV